MNDNRKTERIERIYADPGAEWEPVSETDARAHLGKHYHDVDAVFDAMRDGKKILTPFARYRIAE